MPAIVRPVAGERDGLLAFLAQQRHVLRIAAHGLTDEQARQVPSRSPLSVGGLVKHVAITERGWLDVLLQRQRTGSPPGSGSAAGADFQLEKEETLDDVLAWYEKVASATEKAVKRFADLGQPVPVPKGVSWFPQHVVVWSVRWVLLHLIQETARHAGHAEIVREHIDGATSPPLLAAAEGRPPAPWVEPWEPG
ncbi:DinB family protein [Amycolatopsis acidicola]|uniref:DinB family protein n=1 Tax=Amycolatopsis acidicola TaxID=2596893 RepID=A0A5N0UPL2_9PSEU|nr:DinB family protein [Amycolatopsis acidicola]KAA9148894.1 DinB family protein [Amycolatopsis acidicola]